MRFKLDENLPASLRELLQKYQHQAATVIDEGLGGSGDRELFAACQDEKLVIVTLDTDFANLKAFPPETIKASWSCGSGGRVPGRF